MSSEDNERFGGHAPSEGDGPEASDKGEDAVGYKRPPKRSRFRKGRSGNPRGRPKKVPSRREIVCRVLLEKREVDLTGKGGPRQWRIIEIVILRLRQSAVDGNTGAFKTYSALESRYGVQEQACQGGVLIIPTVDSRETWIKLFGAKD